MVRTHGRRPGPGFARTLINAAKDGILFLFFNPGAFVRRPAGALDTLTKRSCAPSGRQPRLQSRALHHGVVNQQIPSLKTADRDNRGSPKHLVMDPTVPTIRLPCSAAATNRRNACAMIRWCRRTSRTRFTTGKRKCSGTGVHVHSKVIVLDPFGDHPVVMTGSHNLGFKASHENDDNLMIVEGNAPLAAAFAANIIAIYQNYRWNSYVEAHRADPEVWHGLVDTDVLAEQLSDWRRIGEIKFWLGTSSVGGPPPPAPPDPPARTASASGPASAQPAAAAKKSTPAKAKAKKAAVKKKPPAKKKAAAKKKKQ